MKPLLTAFYVNELNWPIILQETDVLSGLHDWHPKSFIGKVFVRADHIDYIPDLNRIKNFTLVRMNPNTSGVGMFLELEEFEQLFEECEKFLFNVCAIKIDKEVD